uniref:protein DpdD n=1 Tax=Burkholderia vietnamiensis TaxID=60552 RepID=UPI000B30647F|nr:protein DpdD [Burkholderia vietnamiensis]
MITADSEVAQSIASHLRERSKGVTFPNGTEALCDQLLETVDSASFPGALVPELRTDGELVVIAIAEPASWRRLCPVLLAFAGPTLTSFDGLPAPDQAEVDLAAVIAAVGPHVTATIRLPSDPRGQQMALRALVRARDTLVRAPSLTRTAPEPTSWLLARFQDFLNVGRRDAATSILDQLRSELRLDALNLRFLQVQLLATFEEWREIFNLPGFTNLTLARRTPATTAILLEALYQNCLAPLFAAGDKEVLQKVYVEEVRPLAAPLLKTPLPASLRVGGWRIAGIEALLAPGRTDLRYAVADRYEQLGWLANHLAPVASIESSSHQGAHDDARELLIATEATESVDLMAAALAALTRLNEKQRAELAQAEPFRSALRGLQHEADNASVPTSWATWLARTSDPTFTNALVFARLGAEEWVVAEDVDDPASVSSFLDELNYAQNNPLAAERTAQALPYLVAALRRDALFPNPGMTPIYSGILTLLALGSARGASTFDSSLTLVDALLTVGVSAADYRELAADVDEIAGEGFGARMVYWALEIIEVFMRSPAPDSAARDRLVHSVLARLVPIHARLSSLQQATLHNLSEEFGWTLGVPPARQGARNDELTVRMRGKTIAIYSLVENASRQAKAALQTIASDIDVQCNADPVGSSQLRALATNSDLFVVAWAAAKHAATDFIRTHRSGRPMVYADGKGVSSLLRAVEDYFREPSRQH